MDATATSHIQDVPKTNSKPNGKATDDASPADWMQFGVAMGWNITAMSAGKPVRFEMKDGESIHVTNAMRREIMAAIEKAKRGD